MIASEQKTGYFGFKNRKVPALKRELDWVRPGGIGWKGIGITPGVGWARSESNRRSRLCKSRILTTRPRARERQRP